MFLNVVYKLKVYTCSSVLLVMPMSVSALLRVKNYYTACGYSINRLCPYLKAKRLSRNQSRNHIGNIAEYKLLEVVLKVCSFTKRWVTCCSFSDYATLPSYQQQVEVLLQFQPVDLVRVQRVSMSTCAD